MIIDGREYPDMDDDEKEAVIEALSMARSVVEFVIMATEDQMGLGLCALELAGMLYREALEGRNLDDVMPTLAHIALSHLREDQQRK